MQGSYEELDGRARPVRHLGRVRLLPRRARPRARVLRPERPHARARGRSGGRLIPFVRLDLTKTPLEEAARALDLGARGIKLHPRAQAFALDDERLGPIFELARRALGADPHPRRPRAAADRGAPGGARPAQRRRPPHRRARRHRGHGRSRRAARRDAGRLLRHLGLERGRSPRPLPPGPARAGRLRLGLPVRPPAELAARSRSARPGSPASTMASSAGCSARTRAASRTTSRCRR